MNHIKRIGFNRIMTQFSARVLQKRQRTLYCQSAKNRVTSQTTSRLLLLRGDRFPSTHAFSHNFKGRVPAALRFNLPLVPQATDIMQLTITSNIFMSYGWWREDHVPYKHPPLHYGCDGYINRDEKCDDSN
jgi:hypothetical protein